MVFHRIRSTARLALAAAFVLSAFFLPINSAWAGPFSPDGDQSGSNGVVATSPLIQEWASGVANYTPGDQGPPGSAGASTLVTYTNTAYAIGPAPGPTGNAYNPGPEDGDVVSLGYGGSITLTFAQPITNGAGADFAVYDNKFEVTAGNYFLELATVSVSSDGTHFFTFPSVSLTQTTTQVGGSGNYGTLDPTNLYNLAGSEITGYGTPFDLSDLSGITSPYLNLNDITEVRLTNVVGNISLTNGGPVSYDDASNPIFSSDSFYTGSNNIINEPYPVDAPSAGFSLAGVAVLNTLVVPEPSGVWYLLPGLGALVAIRRYSRRGRAGA